jgi:hypothetical protein
VTAPQLRSTEQVARDRYTEQAGLARATAEAVNAVWALLDLTDIARSWAGLFRAPAAILTAAQRSAAAGADSYVQRALDAQEMAVTAEAMVDADSLAGVASDGRPLDSLLYQPAITTLTAIKQGAAPTQAKLLGSISLDMIVRTQVADAGRVATGIAVATRPSVGYIRMLNPPSCSRCVVLAGRWYRWNRGFQRHPRCFPAGVAVTGPSTLAASRRWYEGELVVLATAGGKQLSLTGNHPVLTRRGWLPAHLLQEGDEVVSCTRTKGATPLVVPDHQQVPALVEDVWRSLGMGGLHRVPSAAEDFHGDGQNGEVDVVYADRALRDVPDGALIEQLREVPLTLRRELALPFDQQRMSQLVDAGRTTQPRGRVGGLGLPLAFGRGHAGSPCLPGGASVAPLNAMLGEPSLYDVAADPVLAAQGVLARASEVGVGDIHDRQRPVSPRWDAPGGPMTVENRGTHAGRGLDLLERLTGQVELDRLVDVRRVEWSGHVYSLTSAEGWHSANSLIVSNCDCIHVPASEDMAGDLRTDPKLYFDSLSEGEQSRIFTQAGARAIRDGADISQVVNARRGAAGLAPAGARLTVAERQMLKGGRERGHLQTTKVFGQDVFITTEGVTTRGAAGVRLGARETGRKQGGRYRSARIPRLMPESIYQAAGDNREEAIRLLRRFGYIF